MTAKFLKLEISEQYEWFTYRPLSMVANVDYDKKVVTTLRGEKIPFITVRTVNIPVKGGHHEKRERKN